MIFDSQGKCIFDIQRVFLHEFGHALGLNHPDSAEQKVDAVMNSVVSNRSLLAPGEEVLIGGFIVGGRTTKQIVVRALGAWLGVMFQDVVCTEKVVQDGGG